MMPIAIGRGATNQLVIPHPSVSTEHALLTAHSKTEFWLEDRSSANGTFVNDAQIAKILIKVSDKVVLSNQINISDKLKPYFEKLLAAPEAPKIYTGEAFKTEMIRLRSLYDGFEQQKRKIIEEQRYRLNVLKPTLTALIAGTSLATCYLMGLETNIMFLVSGIGAVIAFFVIKDHSYEKNTLLEHEKQMKYICPACEAYLGNTIPDVLEKRGHQCKRFKP